jgi:hypothetical protein
MDTLSASSSSNSWRPEPFKGPKYSATVASVDVEA